MISPTIASRKLQGGRRGGDHPPIVLQGATGSLKETSGKGGHRSLKDI